MAGPNIGILLTHPFESLVERVQEGIEKAGHGVIRPAHQRVFQFIEPEGSRLTVLAGRAQLTKQSMTYLVEHLEAHGYLERLPDPTDGRARIIRLTEKGRQTVAIARGLIEGIEAEWARGLGEHRMRQLRSLLDRLNALVDGASTA